MNSKLNRLTAVCALLCVSSLGRTQAMPEGKGKAEIERSCMDCHGPDIVLVRKTPEAWRKTVIDMAGRGGDSTPEEINNMIAYLSKYYGIDKPATPQPPAEKPQMPDAAGARLACADAFARYVLAPPLSTEQPHEHWRKLTLWALLASKLLIVSPPTT